MSITLKKIVSTAMTLGILFALCLALVGCGGLGSGVTPKSSLEDYTWDELSAISGEISRARSDSDAIEIAQKYNLTNSNGKLDGTQTKTIQLGNGISTYVQIAGFYHDDKADGSGKAGITFIFGDIIAAHEMNSTDTSDGGWEGSTMRSWLAMNGMNLLPSDLKGLVVEVKKSTNNVGGSIGYSDDTSSVTVTSDRLWLFSFMELTGGYESDPYGSIYEEEGSQYKLFKDCGAGTGSENQILIKTYEENDFGWGDGGYPWWERTPYLGNGGEGTRFLDVEPQGDAYGYLSASGYRVGVVPGFCI